MNSVPLTCVTGLFMQPLRQHLSIKTCLLITPRVTLVHAHSFKKPLLVTALIDVLSQVALCIVSHTTLTLSNRLTDLYTALNNDIAIAKTKSALQTDARYNENQVKCGWGYVKMITMDLGIYITCCTSRTWASEAFPPGKFLSGAYRCQSEVQ